MSPVEQATYLTGTGVLGAPDSEPIPLVQLDNSDPARLSELVDVVSDVARRGDFVLGAEVSAFEDDFAKYCGTSHAIGVASGTAALTLALRALDIGPGDEVIVPANSFVATAEAVTLAGATPRFADVDALTHLITASTVEPLVSTATAAVVPVHLYGRTVDMGPILALAKSAGLAVIEDACQAHGARYRGQPVGSLGDCGCFSFYPTKNLGCWGDGGAVTTDDAQVADRIRLLRSHGERPRYHHRCVGDASRLDTIQAAVLRRKLPLLEGWNGSRRRIAAGLTRLLTEAPVAQPASPSPGEDHVFHQYVVTTGHRDELRAHLSALGIPTAVHYPVPIHLTPAYRSSAGGGDPLPVAERLCGQICSLPIYPAMPADTVLRIGEAVRAFAAGGDDGAGAPIGRDAP